jgi:lipopolysaccharide export LptBFGC system permease protein LptF
MAQSFVMPEGKSIKPHIVMKTGFVLTVLLVVFAGSVSAQNFQKKRRLMQEEVPILIVKALQKDFSAIADKGKWELIYHEDVRTSQLTPDFYVFTNKEGAETAQVYFRPDGIVDHTKGVAAPAGASEK